MSATLLVKGGYRAAARPGYADFDRAVIEELRPLFAVMRPRPRDDREALASARIFAMEFGARHSRMAAIRGDYHRRGRSRVHWDAARHIRAVTRSAVGELSDFATSTLRCWVWDGAELVEDGL